MAYSEEGKINIHTENIFPIIKKAVYSDHEIFLRELISNSVDAINKRKMASKEDECESPEEPQILISIDKEAKTITLSDNGIGMSSDEVKKYINQVAFSSAEDFLNRYDKSKEQIIGHFGLGFYSSFMVANKVNIITKSALGKSECVKWTCDGSPNFKLESSERKESGTDVILHLMDEEKEYLEEQRLKLLITKYCDFLPVPILLNNEPANKMSPPWKKNTKDLTDQDYKEFYHYLYPFQGDPLFWVHLNTDYPYNLQGILYFPKISGRADWENGEIKLYSNQVFVSDSIKEVVPRYLLPLRGVIDSADIPLNVSRSALQTDRRVRSIGNFVSKKISDKLKLIKNDDPNFYVQVWNSIAPFIKIGSMEDSKFSEQVENIIIFQTKTDKKDDEGILESNNLKYTTINDYKKRANISDKILYYTDEIAQSTALSIWRTQGAEVIKADNVIDTQFISWLESNHEDLKFQRVDSDINDGDIEKENQIVNKDGGNETENIKAIFEKAINNEKVSIKVSALNTDDGPPTIILLPEQMRRMTDVTALIEQRLPGLPEEHVLMVNRNHPLINGLLKLSAGSLLIGNQQESPSEKLSKDLAKHLYEMAKSSIGGLKPEEISSFQLNSALLLTALVDKVL